MSEDFSEQIVALRGEASQARSLAATMTDEDAVMDLTLYAEALEAEADRLVEALGTPQPDQLPVPSEASFLARLTA